MKLYPLALLACAGSLLCGQPNAPQPSYNFYRDYMGYFLISNTALMNEQKRDLPQANIDPAQAEAPSAFQTPDVTLHEPDAAETMGLYLTILSQKRPLQPKSVLDKQVTEKLNLLSGPAFDPDYSVLSIFPTTTVFGKFAAAQRLIKPQSSIEELEKLQRIIAYLSEQPGVLKRLENALKKVQQGQSRYAYCFKPQNDATSQMLNALYFPDFSGFKGLNKSTTALSAYYYYQAASNLYSLIPLHAVGSISNHVSQAAQAASWGQKLKDCAKLPYRITKEVITTELLRHYPGMYRYHVESKGNEDHISTNANRPTISMGDLELLVRHGFVTSMGETLLSKYGQTLNGDFAKKPGFAPKLMAYGTTVFEDSITLFRGVMFYIVEKAYTDILKNFQTKLMGIAQIVEGFEELNAIVHESNVAELEELATDITALVESQHGNNDLGRLIRALKTDTFKGYSYFSNKPRILATNTLMNERKLDFLDALYQLGDIDALAAAARRLKDHKNTATPFCLATFVTEELPVIKLTDCWNVLIPNEKAVCNSVHLGLGGDANMHLAGSNGCGKSTTMKSIAFAVVMAQTFGIAPAKEMILAPFSRILVYLDEKEDIHKGLSTFMAEKQKLDAVCKSITNLAPGERSFALMDETIKGTVEASAEKLVYEALKGIANSRQSVVIVATHFFEPTKLEADTGRFTNFHVGVLEHADGTFTRTYELLRGSPEWWFSDAGKRERFINWLMNEIKPEEGICAAPCA